MIEPASFRDEVLATAEGIAATAPIASRLTKLALADGGHADFESCLQWEAMAQPITLATADLQEGIRAAQEKRPPVFTGPERQKKRPPVPPAGHLPSPCECPSTGPGASSGHDARSAGGQGQRGAATACGQPCGQTCG